MAMGGNHLPPEEADYSQRLFYAVLNQVIRMRMRRATSVGNLLPMRCGAAVIISVIAVEVHGCVGAADLVV